MIGTSGVVYPAAYIPPYIVKERGGKVIEINVERSGITPIADVFIRGGKAGEVMPKLLERVKDILASGNHYG